MLRAKNWQMTSFLKMVTLAVRQCHRVLSLVLDVAVGDQRIGVIPAKGTKLTSGVLSRAS